MEMTREEMDKHFKVRVTKKVPDDRTSLLGEPVIARDAEGRDYFVIPACHRESVLPLGYLVGKEYLDMPGQSTASSECGEKFICLKCGTSCKSAAGLAAHLRNCTATVDVEA